MSKCIVPVEIEKQIYSKYKENNNYAATSKEFGYSLPIIKRTIEKMRAIEEEILKEVEEINLEKIVWYKMLEEFAKNEVQKNQK